MSTWDGGFSPAQNFHPEFGYLCPSARFRRKARNAAFALAAGTLIAASMALALLPPLLPRLAPQPSADGVRQEGREESVLSPMTLPPTIDKTAEFKATSPADEGVPAATVRAIATERAASARAQASCDDLSGSFLAPQCQLGKTGKSHATHTAHAARDTGNRVATVSIGRADAAPQAGPREPAARQAAPQELPRKVAASGPAPAAETAATAVATNEAPTVAKPAVPAKKPVKTAQKQAPSRNVASAESPAAPHGFDLFALFHQPPRTGSGFGTFQ
jgi:hypothetical protein